MTKLTRSFEGRVLSNICIFITMYNLYIDLQHFFDFFLSSHPVKQVVFHLLLRIFAKVIYLECHRSQNQITEEVVTLKWAILHGAEFSSFQALSGSNRTHCPKSSLSSQKNINKNTNLSIRIVTQKFLLKIVFIVFENHRGEASSPCGEQTNTGLSEAWSKLLLLPAL